MNDVQIRKWLGARWRSLIGYTPTIVRLMKDWYSFHFQKMKDLYIVWKLPWVYGRSFLALHRWYIGFDPLRNTPHNNYIWVKLPALPIELWTRESLACIWNAIGKFVYVDIWCLGANDKRVAWILVEKDYRGGFLEHIDLFWGALSTCQRLDHWGVPFRCSLCHKMGQLKHKCPRQTKAKTRQKDHRVYQNYQVKTTLSGSEDDEKFFYYRSSPITKISPAWPLHISSSPFWLGEPFLRPFLSPRNHKSSSTIFSRSNSMGNLLNSVSNVFPSQPPPPQPSPDIPIISPSPIPKENTILLNFSSSSSSPTRSGHVTHILSPSTITPHPPIVSHKSSKGKAPLISISPRSSPIQSPTNALGNDLDMLLQRESLSLLPLTIDKPRMSTSPTLYAHKKVSSDHP